MISAGNHMRLASYNVENLFQRARALNMDTWAEGKPILDKFAELNTLFEELVYTPEHKARMLVLLKELGLEKVNESKFVVLRVNRGQLVKHGRFGGPTIVADGRADWVGDLELRTEIINEVSTRNTAQVIRDLDPDVLGVVECESRTALLQFSNVLLPAVGATPFEGAMLIDGNDERGIDVGLMTRRGYQLNWMKSHVDDKDEGSRQHIFSRDCPEYGVYTPTGQTVWVLVNHFKSKGYGTQDGSDRKRRSQAAQVARIVARLEAEQAPLIAVIGDLNDTPDSAPLAPLMACGLRDISQHGAFESDGHPGTYGRGGEKDKIDYIMLSPALYDRVQRGGVWRKGVWGPNKKPAWEVYPEMTNAEQSASDHAALWVDIDV
jgi:endonuclease/exonuclease/phosphatase family metal-dependent hydrolase